MGPVLFSWFFWMETKPRSKKQTEEILEVIVVFKILTDLVCLSPKLSEKIYFFNLIYKMNANGIEDFEFFDKVVVFKLAP